MAFILSANRRTPEEAFQAFARYRSYLDSVAAFFPASALTLARSDWYFSNDPRSPHDSWLQSIEIHEQAHLDRSERRSTQMEIRLLGAYHDAYIVLCYRSVFNYEIRTQLPSDGSPRISLGDWLWDEFTLGKGNHLIHEIEWEHGRWVIEAQDVEYSRETF